MKKIFFLLSFVFLIGHFVGCDDKVNPVNDKEKIIFPEIQTEGVDELDYSGVTLYARILDSGNQKIVDYGFELISRENAAKISISSIKEMEDFSIRITFDVEDDFTYEYRAYVQIEDSIVYGNRMFFTGINYYPVIEDIFPKEGYDNTIIKLSGKKFGENPKSCIISINDHLIANPITLCPDSLTFKLPENDYTGEINIRIKVNNRSSAESVYFNIVGPKIDFLSSLSGHSGEYLICHGEHLINNGENVEVYFDSQPAQILEASGTDLKIAIPYSRDNLLKQNLVSFKLINGKKNLLYPQKFTIEKSWTEKTANCAFNWSWRYSAFTYQGCGYLLELNTKNLHKYDPVLDQWSELNSSTFPGDRNEGSLYIVKNNKVYKTGGRNDMYQALSELWSYNFDIHQWNQESDLPFSFSGATYFEINNKTYIVTEEQQVWECDLENNIYVRKNDFPIEIKEWFIYSFTVDESAYISFIGTTWKYDRVNDKWTQKADYPVFPFYWLSESFIYNNTGYIIDYSVNDIYKYFAEYDLWIPATGYPGPSPTETYKTAFTIGDKAYIMSHRQGGECHLFEYKIK